MPAAASAYAPAYDGGSRSRWYATIYTQNGAELDLTPHIVSVSWAKSIEAPSGTWSITLKRVTDEPSWDELIEDDDWVVLECEVALRDRPPDRAVVTVGLIDSVRERRRSVGGAEVVEVVVSGRDFGKVFEETEIYFQASAAEAARNEAEARGAEFNANFAGAIFFKPGAFTPSGSPAVMLQSILGAFLGRDGLLGGQWVVPPGIGDRMRLPPAPTAAALARIAQADLDVFARHVDFESLVSDAGGQTVDLGLVDLSGRPGKLHQLLLQYTEPIVHELFYDVRPVTYPAKDAAGVEVRRSDLTLTTMAVVFRPRPFPVVVPLTGDPARDVRTTDRGFVPDEISRALQQAEDIHAGNLRGAWNALPTHGVPGSDVTESDIGRGGHERYNFFAIYPAADLVQAGDPLFGAVSTRAVSMDPTSIRIHGLRIFEHATRYARHAAPLPAWKAVDRDLAYSKAVHDRVKLWYALNAHLYNGTVTLKRLYPQIRIGDRVWLVWREGKGITFYVEGVQHEWRYPHRGQTILTLTRGARTGDQRLRRVEIGDRT